jgi:hypothetical protein
LSGFVGFVDGGKDRQAMPDTSTRAAIIAAMHRGLKTPGSIATAAKLGATVTYPAACTGPPDCRKDIAEIS